MSPHLPATMSTGSLEFLPVVAREKVSAARREGVNSGSSTIFCCETRPKNAQNCSTHLVTQRVRCAGPLVHRPWTNQHSYHGV